MKITEYANKKDQFQIPQNLDSIGQAADPETKNELLVGVHVHRKVYKETGYICNEDAPEELHACMCALLEDLYDMPIIKTVLLKPEDLAKKICGDEPVPEAINRYSHLALFALNSAMQGFVASIMSEN